MRRQARLAGPILPEVRDLRHLRSEESPSSDRTQRTERPIRRHAAASVRKDFAFVPS